MECGDKSYFKWLHFTKWAAICNDKTENILEKMKKVKEENALLKNQVVD